MITESPESAETTPSVPGPSPSRPIWHSPYSWMTAALLLRLALLPLNHGEYTDGLLQLEALTLKIGLYPPLYGALAGAISALGIEPETAGKILSALASAATILPLWWIVRLAGGSVQAAAWASALYLLHPLTLRWGIRVMTDSLFLLLSTTAMAALTAGVQSGGPTGPRKLGEDPSTPGTDPGTNRAWKSVISWLWLAAASAALATLTRWQGLALLPLHLATWIYLATRSRSLWLPGLLTLLPWALVPLGGYLTGFAHGGQFAERTTSDPVTTLLAYWNTAESFVLISPYIFGYPVVGLAVYQTVRRGWGTWSAPTVWLWVLFGGAFLVAQSAFGSFQYRYLMPVLPLILVLAGLALAHWQNSGSQRHLAWWVGGAALVFMAGQSTAVLLLQRGTFGDQREVARWAGANLPPEMPVYSNERYGNFQAVGSLKLSRWSGRPVQFLASPSEIAGKRVVLIASNAYGGDGAVSALLGAVAQTHRLRPLFSAERTVVAIHDDVMASPMLNQNPMGWVLRYVPQNFRTQLLLAEPRP